MILQVKNVMGGLHHKPPLSSLDITWIHKYSDDKVYTTIPDIDEGEYFLALMILMKDKESFLYIFPISLIVQFT